MKKLIDSKLYTIPLKGELKRKPDGTKTLPVFETDWKAKYTKNRNTEVTPIGGVLTGSINNLIAIDCDCETSWTLFRSLDPDYSVCFESIGKGKVCGTILYEYDADIDAIKLKGALELDVLTDGGMFYAPTEANETKETLESFEGIKAMPAAVKALLLSIKPVKVATTVPATSVYRSTYIASLYRRGELTPLLRKALTPARFRPEIDPNKVDSGASDYLTAVAAILASDPSVDINLACELLDKVNELYDYPLDQDRVEHTIKHQYFQGTAESGIEYKGTATRNEASPLGEPAGSTFWNYDEEWESTKMTYENKQGGTSEVLYDPGTLLNYVVDLDLGDVTVLRNSNLAPHVQKTSKTKISPATINQRLVNTKVITNPKAAFGYSGDSTDSFNVFKQSKYLELLHSDTKDHRYPTPVLHLIANLFNGSLEDFEEDRLPQMSWFLKHLRHRLTTFDYSSVVYMFKGNGGTGKDMLFSFLSHLVGEQYYSKVEPSDLNTDAFNGHLEGKLIGIMDEVKSSRGSELSEGIKRFVGNPKQEFLYHYKGETKCTKPCFTMLFMSSNEYSPVDLDSGSRRYAIAASHTPLAKRVSIDQEGYGNLLALLESYASDFMVWLKENYELFTSQEGYVDAPDFGDRIEMQVNNMSMLDKFAHYMVEDDLDGLVEDLSAGDNGDCVRELLTEKEMYISPRLIKEACDIAIPDNKIKIASVKKVLAHAGLKVTRLKIKDEKGVVQQPEVCKLGKKTLVLNEGKEVAAKSVTL